MIWNCLRNWFRCFDISSDLITGIPNETNCSYLCEYIPLRNTILSCGFWFVGFFLIPTDHVNERNKLSNITKTFYLKAIKTNGDAENTWGFTILSCKWEEHIWNKSWVH